MDARKESLKIFFVQLKYLRSGEGLNEVVEKIPTEQKCGEVKTIFIKSLFKNFHPFSRDYYMMISSAIPLLLLWENKVTLLCN